MTKPVAVINGAGIAGLAAAWWLDKAGFQSVIIERADSLRDNGYMLGLSGLGYQTVARMGLLDALNAASYTINENVYKDSNGKELLRLRYRDFIRDLPYLALRRNDLVRALADALPPAASIRFSDHIESFTDKGDRVEVRLASGAILQADLLIGADGFRSWTRQKLFGPDNNDASCLQPLGYYFAVYDVDAPRAFETDFLSYAEPGHLAEYYALHGGRLAAMHVWREARVGLQETEDRYDLLKNVSAQSHPEVRHLLDQAKQQGSPVLIDSLTMVALAKWSRGRVLLLGDSAHCLTLVSGQGAGMALCSAEMLGKALLAEADIDKALALHEQTLRPIIGRLQARSRKMAAVFIPRSALAFRFRNFVMRNIPRAWLGRYFTSTIKAEIALASDTSADITD